MNTRLSGIVYILSIVLIGLLCCTFASAKITSVNTSNPISGFNTTTIPQFTFNVSGNYSGANYSCKLLLNNTIYVTNATVINYTSTNLTNNTITNGTYSWLINCSDVDGYNTSALLNLTIDGIPPATAFDASTSMQSGNYSRSYIYVNVTANDSLVGLASINISLYNSTGFKSSNYSNSSSSLFINFTGLADGIYYVNATVKDYLNNTNYTSTRVMILDNVVPSLTILSPSSGYFNSKNIVVNFTANDTLAYNNTNITVYNSTNSLVNSTVSAVAGNQLINLSVLIDGTYYVNVTAFDGAGNVNRSQVTGIIIDTTKPSIVINSPTTPTYLNVTQIAVNLTVGDVSFNYTNITIYNSTGSFVNSTINTTNGTYVVSLGVPYNGNFTINVTARDLANNTNSSSVQSVIVDTIAPTITSTAPATNAHFSTQNVSYTLSETAASAVIVFTRTGGTADGNVHTCSLQGTALNSGAHTNFALVTGANNCASWANALVDSANYTVTFDATDFASNHAVTITNTNVVYDITAPTLTIVHVQSSNVNNISLAKTGDAINLTFIASKLLQTPTVTIAGHTATIVGSGANWTANYTMAGGDSEGIITFAIIYNDTAGNNGTAVNTTTDSSTVIFDKTSPAITGTYSGSGWQTSTASIILNASDAGLMASGVNIISYNFDGGTWTNVSSNVTTASISSSGNHTIYYYSVDVAGNVGSTKNITNILVDVTVPTTNITGLASNGSIYIFDAWSNNTVLVNFTGSDNIPGSGYNSTYYCTDNVNTCTPSTTYTSPFNVTASGTTYIRFYGIDNVNNNGSIAYKRVMILNSAQVFLNQSTTVTTNQTTIVVQKNNTVANITVPSTVNNATLDISENFNVSTGNATLTGVITISANTSSAQIITVQLPAGITVSGNVGLWNGNINLPQVESTSTVSPTADSGYTATVSKVIEVGANNVELVLNKAVRINLSGEGGKMVGWSRGSTTVNKIINTCTVDSQAWADANVSSDSECVYDYGTGNDIIVWTKHFTSFVTYTEAVTPVVAASSSSGNSNDRVAIPKKVLVNADPFVDVSYALLPMGTKVIKFSDIDIPLTELSLNTNANISDVVIKITAVSTPSVSYTGAVVYKYVQVNHDAVADANIVNAEIKFKVDKSWLTNNNVDKNSIELLRYADNTWAPLNTSIYSEDTISEYYVAESPGLSLFAITVLPSTQPATETLPPVQPTVESKTNANAVAVSKNPVDKKTYNITLIVLLLILLGVLLWGLIKNIKSSNHSKKNEIRVEDHAKNDEVLVETHHVKKDEPQAEIHHSNKDELPVKTPKKSKGRKVKKRR